MKIDSIELKRIKPEGTLQGFASCIISGGLNLKLCSIGLHVEGKHYWITFPKLRTPSGELFFSYIPLDDITHRKLEKAIIEKYEKEIKSL